MRVDSFKSQKRNTKKRDRILKRQGAITIVASGDRFNCIPRMRLMTFLLLFLLGSPLIAEISALQEGQNLKVKINGKLFTEYRTDQHVPCLYPLMSPDGTHLTRQFPF